jgi:hypothetical protein
MAWLRWAMMGLAVAAALALAACIVVSASWRISDDAMVWVRR